MALLGLLVGASLWIVVAAGMQRAHLGPMLLPQGSGAETTTLDELIEPIPLPGGAGHLVLPSLDGPHR